MLAAHALTDMTNAWAFSLHPGVDHCLKRGHAISALSAIKALEPIHLLVLSDEQHTYATQKTVSSEGYCIIVGNPFAISTSELSRLSTQVLLISPDTKSVCCIAE